MNLSLCLLCKVIAFCVMFFFLFGSMFSLLFLFFSTVMLSILYLFPHNYVFTLNKNQKAWQESHHRLAQCT